MAFLEYELPMQCRGIGNLILVLLLTLPVASSDVTIWHGYYATGSECHEQVFLHNMDYTNSATISDDDFYADSQAYTAEQSAIGKFIDSIYLNSMGNPQGASLEVNAKDAAYSRTLSGYPYAGLSYSMGSGTSNAHLFTPTSTFNEKITSVNNRYAADLGAYKSQSYSSGQGTSTVDAPSSFDIDISTTFAGKNCKIESFLKSYGTGSAAIPVSYEWTDYSTSKREYSLAGIDIFALQGNRDVDLGIKGSSSFLSNKFSPASYEHGTPDHLDPIGSGSRESRDDYMQYRIS